MSNIREMTKLRITIQRDAIIHLKHGDMYLAARAQNEVFNLNMQIAKAQQDHLKGTAVTLAQNINQL